MCSRLLPQYLPYISTYPHVLCSLYPSFFTGLAIKLTTYYVLITNYSSNDRVTGLAWQRRTSRQRHDILFIVIIDVVLGLRHPDLQIVDVVDQIRRADEGVAEQEDRARRSR
jgi:predicted anti-sigma-YlaC factor YlaD